MRKQPFVFPYFKELAPSAFSRTAPLPQTFVNGTDFATMQYSGSGEVTAAVTAVGPLHVPIGDTPAGTTTSGCDAADRRLPDQAGRRPRTSHVRRPYRRSLTATRPASSDRRGFPWLAEQTYLRPFPPALRRDIRIS